VGIRDHEQSQQQHCNGVNGLMQVKGMTTKNYLENYSKKKFQKKNFKKKISKKKFQKNYFKKIILKKLFKKLFQKIQVFFKNLTFQQQSGEIPETSDCY
jgi:hypothetical protein